MIKLLSRTVYIPLMLLLFSNNAYAGRTINSATVDGGASTSVTAGDSVATIVNVTTSGNGSNDDWKATSWQIGTDPAQCSDHADETNDSTTNKTFNISAPATDGTYDLTLKAYKNDSCNGSEGSSLTLSNAITVTGGSSGGGGSELLCSAKSSNAVINEIQTSDNFIEIYLLNSTDILNWALYVDTTKIVTLGTGSCEINGTAVLDNAGSTTLPAGTFITCDHNMNPSKDEVLLVDTNGSFSNGDSVVIDYIGYGNLTPSADWAVNSSCGTLYPGHAANNKDIARVPDGTGVLEDNDSNSTKGTTNSPPTGPDHYEIHHDGNGLTCAAEPITVKACSNADCTSLYTNTLTAKLAIGNTKNNITITGGSVSYNFNYTSTGTKTVALSQLSESASISCYINNTLDTGCEITFADAGLVIDVPTLTSCKPNATATIKAVQLDNVTNTCGAAFTGDQTIKFWSDYVSPNNGSNALTLDTTNIATNPSGTNKVLNFDNNGLATFTLQYDDAGQMELNASATAITGDTLEGSDTFISKPVALAVYSDDANADCASGDATCSLFKKAGESFNLKIKAACWTSDSDADFTDNPATENFELSSIAVGHSLVAPSGGNNGSISTTSVNFRTQDNGIHTMTQTVSEVGVFSFNITPPTYFGETLTTAISPNIGRFYPDHFKLTTVADGDFTNACTGFSYSGQDFSYQTAPELKVTAYNAASPAVITQNYTGSFAKLSSTDFTVTAPTSDASQLGVDNTNKVALTWAPASPTLTDNADGSLNFVFGADSYTYSHEANSKIAEFTNAVDLVFTAISDSDSVTAQGLDYTLQPSGESIRFGRFAIDNAHGSELAPLPITMTAEYFNGVNWVANSADQCTNLDLITEIQLSNPSTASGSWQAGNSTMTIASGTTSGSFTNNAPLLNGQAILTLSAPGEDNQGYVDIRSQLSINSSWLLGDYDNDGAYDDEPQARASFGLFSGSDNIIFRREVY